MRGEIGESSELTPEYWESLAEDCYTRGKLEAALACREKVRTLDPQSPLSRGVTLCNKAGMLVHRRNFEGGLECIDRSLETFPDMYESWNQKGLILSLLGRPEEALLCFDTALSIAPHNIVSLHCRGGAPESLERWDEALESYHAALKVAPDFAVSPERKAMLERTKGVRDPGQGDRNG